MGSQVAHWLIQCGSPKTQNYGLKKQQIVVQVTMAVSLYYWPSYLLPLVLLIKLVGNSVLCQIGHCEHTAVWMVLYSLEEFCPFNRTSPNPPRRATPDCTECFPGYDMSSDCSTCVGAESIQCVEGQQSCSVSVTYSV